MKRFLIASVVCWLSIPGTTLAQSWVCAFDGKNSLIAERIIFGTTASGQMRVIDPITFHYKNKVSTATVSQNTEHTTAFRWSSGTFSTSSGQRPPNVKFNAVFDKKAAKLALRTRIVGHGERAKGTGACHAVKPKINEIAQGMLQARAKAS